MTRILPVFLLIALSACDRAPVAFPPPEQRHPTEGANPTAGTMMIDMSSPDASEHVLKDVRDNPGGQWRWTGQEPTLKTLVFATDQLKLKADFTLWDEAFKQTGPLDLQFFVNGKQLDQVLYDTPGHKHFEKPVPADWLPTDIESTIAIKVDKLYTAPQDGAKFGVILSRIGFEQ